MVFEENSISLTPNKEPPSNYKKLCGQASGIRDRFLVILGLYSLDSGQFATSANGTQTLVRLPTSHKSHHIKFFRVGEHERG